MKQNKKGAQTLLEALGQVDEGMLQQAFTTDTPERFRPLGAKKSGKIFVCYCYIEPKRKRTSFRMSFGGTGQI